MKIFVRLNAKLDKMFSPPSLMDIVAEQMQQATLERQQARQTILNHRFVEHMAQAKIAALEAWNHKGDLQ